MASFYSALDTGQVLLDLRPKQPSHTVAGELSFERAHCAPRVAEHLGEGSREAAFRLGPLDQNAVKDFYLIEVIALRFKEPLSLIDGRLHYGAIVLGEWDLGPIALQEVLVDVETRSE
jgi:hypothetical protein